MPDCDCGMCPPTWAKRRGRSRRFTAPVTLVEAMDGEDVACRATMVEQHRACLSSMVSRVDEHLSTPSWDDIGQPDVGLTLVLFAGELAAALRAGAFQAELPADIVRAGEQTVTAATLTASGCLAGLVDAVQLLGSLMLEPPLVT